MDQRFLSVFILLAAFALPAASHAVEIFQTPDDGSGFSYLIVNGVIEKNDHRRVERFLQGEVKEGRAVAILLTSPGGGLEETPALSKVILKASNDLYKKNKKFLIVAINEECSSACTVLTAQLTSKRNPKALEILATNSARFGFHSPVNYDGKKTTPIADRKLRERLISKEISYYTDAGISAKWLNKHVEMFRSSEFTDLKAEVLCKESSMIIPPDSCIADVNDITTVIAAKLGKDKTH
jgi:hypothetical protein